MKTWKKTLVTPATLIRKVIETIDRGEFQIAMVVDRSGKLLGTVTDGDVRRGILKGVALHEPVQRIMQKNPVTAKVGQTREFIQSLMAEKLVRQIPILDGKRLAGLEFFDTLSAAGPRDNWVILMAGGLGARLRPLTESRPKPLLNVGERPILETILRNLAEHGFKNFFISVNYQNEMIMRHFGDGSRWGVHIRYLHENKRLGTAGAMGLLPKKPEKPFLVMNADLLTNVNFSQLFQFHHENEVLATMCVREYDFQVPFGVVRIGGHHIEGVDEKPVQRFFVNAGIYVLEPEVLDMLPKKKKEYLDMPHLFNELIAKKRRVSAFPVREYWLDIGRLDDLERANGDFAKIFKPTPKKGANGLSA